jgi:hypothetical protein
VPSFFPYPWSFIASPLHHSVTFMVGTPPHWAAPAPMAMCFTKRAMNKTLKTVGTKPPETGAKGFSPIGKFGFDVVEYDVLGSAEAKGSMYSPSAEWGDSRCQYWLNLPDEAVKLWSGDIHSHPGHLGIPSQRSGPALGDLGYVEEIFAANEAMQYFLLPILTHTSRRGPVIIHPWIICRDDPHRPMWADIRICSVEEFPQRVFNPQWEARVSS